MESVCSITGAYARVDLLNENDREASVSVADRGELVLVVIEGPDSASTNEITYREAKALLACLQMVVGR